MTASTIVAVAAPPAEPEEHPRDDQAHTRDPRCQPRWREGRRVCPRVGLRGADRAHRRRGAPAVRAPTAVEGGAARRGRHRQHPRSRRGLLRRPRHRGRHRPRDRARRPRSASRARRRRRGRATTPPSSLPAPSPAGWPYPEPTSTASTTSAPSTTRCVSATRSGRPHASPSSAPAGSARRSPRRPAKWAQMSCSSTQHRFPSAECSATRSAGCSAQLHADHGVDLRLGVGVSALRGAKTVEQVVLDDGRVEAADVVVAGIGVIPRTELAENSVGFRVDNGIVVDQYLETSVAGVYAAGDVANAWHPHYKRRLRVEHWANALNQGVAAGRNAAGHRDAYVAPALLLLRPVRPRHGVRRPQPRRRRRRCPRRPDARDSSSPSGTARVSSPPR